MSTIRAQTRAFLERYLKANEPVAILFDDAGLTVFNRPPNLHLISTVGLLCGLEDVGVMHRRTM
jgi:hypothetical protein